MFTYLGSGPLSTPRAPPSTPTRDNSCTLSQQFQHNSPPHGPYWYVRSIATATRESRRIDELSKHRAESLESFFRYPSCWSSSQDWPPPHTYSCVTRFCGMYGSTDVGTGRALSSAWIWIRVSVCAAAARLKGGREASVAWLVRVRRYVCSHLRYVGRRIAGAPEGWRAQRAHETIRDYAVPATWRRQPLQRQ